MKSEVTEISEYQIVLNASQTEVNEITDFLAYCVNHLVEEFGDDGVEAVARDLLAVFLGVRER